MDNYIRFETCTRCPDTGRRLGIFVAAGYVEDRCELPAATAHWLRETLAWFNDNLRVPRLSGKEARGIFWFRAAADEVVSRVWDLVAILDNEGVTVEKHRTTKPGAIVYADRFQIAAIPGKRRRRARERMLLAR
jgi:hypothetical protein